MDQDPNDVIQRLKVEVAVLQEGEAFKQTLIKNLEEEIQRLRHQVMTQERRYQQRLEEDLLLERQRSEDEKKRSEDNRMMLQRMMKIDMLD